MHAKLPLVMALGSTLVLLGCYSGRFPDYPSSEKPFFLFGRQTQTAPRPAPPPAPVTRPRPAPPANTRPLTATLPPPAPVMRQTLMAPRVLPGLARFNMEETSHNAEAQEAVFRRELVSSGVDVAREGNLVVLTIGQGLLFSAGSSEVNPSSRTVLTDIAKVLKRYPSTRIDIGGFTDATGTRGFNMRLSQERADAVASLLMTEGVEPTRITAKGYGQEFPKVPTAEGVPEPRNRRVEITLVPPTG